MNEKPIERLNYFNGQRLQAADLKLEQDYHLRVRRWLNRSLYPSGIADGLVVAKVPGVPRVRIGPGLAIDTMGREIILIDEHEETVPGAHDLNNLPLAMYLTIRYGEEVLARQEACCTPVNGSQNKVAWGGPSRVLAEPVFEWSRDRPHESSGKVLLAYVALGKTCTEVNVLDTTVRTNIGTASAAKVKQYALEGIRDIDPLNPGVVVFHIRGQQPNSVTLYLKAEAFPSYYYTEVGTHTHTLKLDGGVTTGGPTPAISVETHDHDLVHLDGTAGPVSTESENSGTGHSHNLNTRIKGKHSNETNGWINVAVTDLDPTSGQGFSAEVLPIVGGSISGGGHTHDIPAKAGGRAIQYNHSHAVSPTGSIDDAGIGPRARATQKLTFVDTIKVTLTALSGNVTNDITTEILDQLAAADAQWVGKSLGNRGPGHVLATMGTGPVRLDFLRGVRLSEGGYRLEMSVAGDGNGGRIHYNLYVE